MRPVRVVYWVRVVFGSCSLPAPIMFMFAWRDCRVTRTGTVVAFWATGYSSVSALRLRRGTRLLYGVRSSQPFLP